MMDGWELKKKNSETSRVDSLVWLNLEKEHSHNIGQWWSRLVEVVKGALWHFGWWCSRLARVGRKKLWPFGGGCWRLVEVGIEAHWQFGGWWSRHVRVGIGAPLRLQAMMLLDYESWKRTLCHFEEWCSSLVKVGKGELWHFGRWCSKLVGVGKGTLC